MPFSWFILNSSGDPATPLSFTMVSGVPSCMGSNRLCAIYAFIGPGNTPVLDDALKDDVIRALDSRMNSATVKLKS